jgi:hypothetical protein
MNSARWPFNDSMAPELERIYYDLMRMHDQGDQDALPGAGNNTTLAVAEATRMLWRFYQAMQCYDREEVVEADANRDDAIRAYQQFRSIFES